MSIYLCVASFRMTYLFVFINIGFKVDDSDNVKEHKGDHEIFMNT